MREFSLCHFFKVYMLIDIVSQNAERELLATIERGEQRSIVRGALYFCASELANKPLENGIILAISPLLNDKQATIYFFADGDLLIAWSGVQKATLDELCQRLYAHFSLTGNKNLHTYYDFNAHGEDLRLLCKQKLETLLQPKNTQTPTKNFLDILPEQIVVFQMLKENRKARKQLEILVVEDQAFSSKLLIGLLERICKTYPAFNAKTALDIYLLHAPDIVFLDVEMPDINGHDLAATISKLDDEAYIVMVTANNYIEDVARAKENGAKGFVAKPYSKQKILENVEKYICERKLPS